jgi:hypothetical protein
MRGIVALVVLRAAVAALVLAGLLAYSAQCNAADLFLPISFAEQSDPNSRPNSILVFAGRMSTTDIWSTMAFNLNKTGTGPYYDNYIAGAAYDRDLFDFGHGFYFGVEVGIADRFGKYKECCNPIVMSNSIVQSAELWTGPQIRYAGVLLFDLVRVGAGVTFGLSVTTPSIGNELGWEIADARSARVLYYLGPEVDFSTPRMSNLEFVLRLQHRSGGKTVPLLPTLADFGEGYNANVAGVRYRF